MNTSHRHTVLAAVAVAALAGVTGQAFAQEATYELPLPAVSSTTRADVRAELLQARQAGTILVTEADFQRQPVFVSTLSRAAVVAEARADAGAAKALTGEPHGFDAPRFAQNHGQSRLVASAAR
jgi:hypothetical protein